MSRLPMSKVEIDILVGLAMFGPADNNDKWLNYGWGFTEGKTVNAVATEWGTMLWQANTEGIVAYTFERVPFPVTAVEGLKMISYYEYQTANDGWLDTAAGRFCDWLRTMLIQRLPGWSDAPWGFTRSEVQSRSFPAPPDAGG